MDTDPFIQPVALGVPEESGADHQDLGKKGERDNLGPFPQQPEATFSCLSSPYLVFSIFHSTRELDHLPKSKEEVGGGGVSAAPETCKGPAGALNKPAEGLPGAPSVIPCSDLSLPPILRMSGFPDHHLFTQSI